MQCYYKKNIILLKIIASIVLICFTGCVTSKIEYVENDKLPKDKVYRLSVLYMKDGNVIDLKGKEPKFKLKYKGIDNVIVYYEEDYNEIYIPLKDVNSLKIEIIESNQIVTALIIVGVAAPVLVLAFFIAIATVGFKMH